MSQHLFKINQEIKAPELRVIDEFGANIGVLSRDAALKLAGEKGLDLIEVVSDASPPVARIIAFDKLRYEQEKKMKAARASRKNLGSKQVQISARAAKNDLEVKAKKANEFLSEGHQLVVMMTLRGREKGNKDWAKKKMGEFLTMITVPHKVISDLQWGGRGVAINIAKL